MARPKSPKAPDADTLRKLYLQQSKSMREVARDLGLHPDTVHYWLKKYKIETRSNVRKSQLLNVPLGELNKKVMRLGIRGFARELGLSEGAVRHHLKIRRAKADA
jgi:DNA-binding CsgD family transcriptional regulator